MLISAALLPLRLQTSHPWMLCLSCATLPSFRFLARPKLGEELRMAGPLLLLNTSTCLQGMIQIGVICQEVWLLLSTLLSSQQAAEHHAQSLQTRFSLVADTGCSRQ